MIHSIKWAINNRCNLRCSYCMMEGTECGEELSYESKKRCLDKIHNMGVSKIDFFGKEVLIDDTMFKLMEYTKNKGYNITFSMISNGVNLEKYYKDIINSPLIFVTFSYDCGVERLTYFSEETLIKVAKSKYVEITIDVHKLNIHKVVNSMKYLEGLGVSSICITPIIPLGGKYENIIKDFHLSEKDIENLYYTITSTKFNMDITFTVPFQYTNLSRMLEGKKYCMTDNYCTAGETHGFLASDGVMYGCVSQYCANNKSNSCDFLSTPIDEIHKIIGSGGIRQCIRY